MRKAAGWVLAAGLVFGIIAGCSTSPNKHSMVTKLQNEVKTLDSQNYRSKAMMTVQMNHTSQTYYIETWYDSPSIYRIALGDENKHINQIIVRNENGMFIVSPSLQKVFRFNGNWAQNQGHIYLYDQILQQIVAAKDNVKMNQNGGVYTFTMPVQSNDVVVKQAVDIDASNLHPKKVVLYDQGNKAVVTISFTDFEQNVKFNTENDFNPQKLVADAKSTMAPTGAETGYIEPNELFGSTLTVVQPEEQDATLLRFTGSNSFTLEEFYPDKGVGAVPDGTMVDLFGVPGVLTGSDLAHQLIWVNNGREFSLTSSKLSVDQMREVAISTMGSTGK